MNSQTLVINLNGREHFPFSQLLIDQGLLGSVDLCGSNFVQSKRILGKT